ncbi:multiple epidermal growth factor-like domains protein 6 [Haliotis asinina]|uniref:multiple epidermal growth factor-like domains protein 6 n=1 Tax=Haliotis asinina TaxID=109174 RepID=UPI0035324D8B
MSLYFAVVGVLVATVYGGCPPGFTGYKCDTQCAPGCLNGACTLQDHGGIACVDGCYDGFSGESCRTTCFGQCKRCDRYDGGHCLECNPGYYGDFCQLSCQTCGTAGCDREGMCKERPRNCDGGVICGETCIQKCRRCSHDGTCSKCQPNYVGDSCQKLCTNCLGTCNQDGCSGGCSCGYYGDLCQKQCSSNCLVSCNNDRSLLMCNRVNGTCLKGCKNGHFGERCQHRCNKNCKDNICYQKGGRCHGCNNGYYGESCENSCTNCKQDICARAGRCYECKNGYFGPNCDLRCDKLCTYACERYSGVCVAQNTTVDVTKITHGATGVGQLPVSSSTQNSSSPNLGEAKSKPNHRRPSIVFWSCIAAGIAVATVVVLTCTGVCHQRFKNRRFRRKEKMMPVPRKISQEDPVPEVPSTVNSFACQNDYEEIPEMSDEVTGLTHFTIDESQAVVRGDVHTARENKMPRKVYLRDTTRNYRSKDVHVNKYLSVMDTTSTDGYLDIIG